jgi:hypothetical protein
MPCRSETLPSRQNPSPKRSIGLAAAVTTSTGGAIAAPTAGGRRRPATAIDGIGGIDGTTEDRLAGNGEAIATGAITGIGVDTKKPFCSAEGLFSMRACDGRG